LRPVTLFSPLVADLPAGCAGRDALASDQPGGRGGRAADRLPRLLAQGRIDLLPPALPLPLVEVGADRLPRGEVAGKHPPLAAAAQQGEDGGDELAQVVALGPARSGARRQQGLQAGLLRVEPIGRIALFGGQVGQSGLHTDQVRRGEGHPPFCVSFPVRFPERPLRVGIDQALGEHLGMVGRVAAAVALVVDRSDGRQVKLIDDVADQGDRVVRREPLAQSAGSGSGWSGS